MQGAAGRVWKFWLSTSILIIAIAPGLSGVFYDPTWVLLGLSYLFVGCFVFGVYYFVRFTTSRSALVRDLNQIDFGELDI